MSGIEQNIDDMEIDESDYNRSAGSVCSNLAEVLSLDNEVIIVDDLSTGNEANIRVLEIELVKGSITDLDFRIAQSEYATRSVLQFRSKMRVNHCNIPKIVSAFRELGAKNIETHIHADFGLSVSSALAGFGMARTGQV